MEIKEQLLFLLSRLKVSSMPLSDIIPTLQKAKDRIQELELQVYNLEQGTKKPLAALFKPLSPVI